MSTLRILCYIRGDDYKQAFEVKIREDEDVGTLRKYIKAKKTPIFDHIPADCIVLWAVNILFDENIKENVDKLGLVDGKSLLPFMRLSKVFSDVSDGYLHIVVKDLLIGEY